MDKLLEALDRVILKLENTSDEELQAQFEKAKGGLISTAIADSEDFLNFHLNSFRNKYSKTFLEVEEYMSFVFNIENISLASIELAEEAANDDIYLLAA
ncbi:hypothetical protein [Pseudoalteromonas lipolytica]|uniref:hypothetical protein n=1 Tax=Pseudoalteromonas lipolytica TaxID=570156 RepID=UPI00309861EA